MEVVSRTEQIITPIDSAVQTLVSKTQELTAKIDEGNQHALIHFIIPFIAYTSNQSKQKKLLAGRFDRPASSLLRKCFTN
jgi:hypothetical protein